MVKVTNQYVSDLRLRAIKHGMSHMITTCVKSYNSRYDYSYLLTAAGKAVQEYRDAKRNRES